MKCSYIRQCLEFGNYQYLQSPKDFTHMPESPYHKDIVNTFPETAAEKKLYIFSLGHEFSDPTKKLLNRVFQRSFIVHYVTGGKGYYNGTPVSRGSTFFCWPGAIHSLETNSEDPLEFYWAFIMGSDLLNYILSQEFNPNNLISEYTWENKIKEIFDDALYSEHPDVDLAEYYDGILHIMMSYHKKANSEIPYHTLSLQDQYLISAINLMSESQYNITVETVAKHIGISRKYFSLLFRQNTGDSPKEYMTKKRIELSRSLLSTGAYRVRDVAELLGYGDYTAFSRAFKKHTGYPPTDLNYASQKNNT